jgi:peptidoglycan L-alanyl-D-glutamate endopeptidase CwlK
VLEEAFRTKGNFSKDMNIPDTIRAVQQMLGITVDGIAGPKTWKAIYDKIYLGCSNSPEDRKNLQLASDTFENLDKLDERSVKNIATLLPEAQPYARALVYEARAAGIDIKVISGTRSYQEQDELYAQGRTKPGPIVTNARAGQSYHNFGLAFDAGVFRNGEYIEECPEYAALGALGKRIGLEWGGDWISLADEPHFQYNPKHLTLAQLRERKEQGLPLV